jgi:hypothetical protein
MYELDDPGFEFPETAKITHTRNVAYHNQRKAIFSGTQPVSVKGFKL